MSDGTYYAVLGISEAATQEEIDRAYRSFGEAYRVLSDPTQRSSYDQQLAQHRQQHAPAQPAPKKAAPACPLYPEVFSEHIGCSVDEANDFLAGKLPITPALAQKLQSEFGLKAEFWMSQPFEEDSINPFAVMAIILFFTGLGSTVFAIVAKVF